jgi:hypothetical protein
VVLSDEGQNLPLTFDGQAVCAGDDLNLVNLPARKAIH